MSIDAKDFKDWSGERAVGVPVVFDPRYATILSMGDTGQPATVATTLVGRIGKGTLIYTTLTLDDRLLGDESRCGETDDQSLIGRTGAFEGEVAGDSLRTDDDDAARRIRALEAQRSCALGRIDLDGLEDAGV